MRIVLNTSVDNAGSRVCIYDLHRRLCAAGVDARLNDWDRYDRYDVAVFMGREPDTRRARAANPRIRVALADPKQSRPEFLAAAREADFLMVSSVEQKDAFLRLNRNVVVFYMFPDLDPLPKTHTRTDPIRIGYHGNRVHLECMVDTVRPALNALARRVSIEFWAIYNPANGRASAGMPDERAMRVRHIPWSWSSYHRELARTDIGIVPGLRPLRNRLGLLEQGVQGNGEFMYEPFDYLHRYKASTNPGRLFPFARLGIPVVADFTPSSCQFIRDGESGFLAASPQGWLDALETLAADPGLRNRFAERLRADLEQAFDRQIGRFLAACTAPLKSGPGSFPGWPTPEEELAHLDRYARPAGRSAWRRLGDRLRSKENGRADLGSIASPHTG